MTDRKAVIKNADMSEDMQQDAVDCATQAMEKYNIEKDIAAYIKKVRQEGRMQAELLWAVISNTRAANPLLFPILWSIFGQCEEKALVIRAVHKISLLPGSWVHKSPSKVFVSTNILFLYLLLLVHVVQTVQM